MMLADLEITLLCTQGEGLIFPFTPGNVQPSSYDLCVDKDVTINHGEFQLWSTLETVTLPAWLQGQVHGRSSIAREGVMVHLSAGFVDPGFTGTLTLEVVSFATKPVTYTKGTRIAQIAFCRLGRPASTPYKGRYQGQEGATESRREES